jgi:hypothetical protein
MFIKIIAYGPINYANNKINVFDAVITIQSVIDKCKIYI